MRSAPSPSSETARVSTSPSSRSTRATRSWWTRTRAGAPRIQNAGRTPAAGRGGSKADGDLGAGFGAYAAFTYIDARFTQAFTSARALPCTPATALGGPCRQQAPGCVPSSLLYAELSWKHEASGFSTALEAIRSEKLYVDDENSQSADQYAVFNWRAVLERKASGLGGYCAGASCGSRQPRRQGLRRLGHRRGEHRAFSTVCRAPGRNYTTGISASYSF